MLLLRVGVPVLRVGGVAQAVHYLLSCSIPQQSPASRRQCSYAVGHLMDT